MHNQKKKNQFSSASCFNAMWLITTKLNSKVPLLKGEKPQTSFSSLPCKVILSSYLPAESGPSNSRASGKQIHLWCNSCSEAIKGLLALNPSGKETAREIKQNNYSVFTLANCQRISFYQSCLIILPATRPSPGVVHHLQVGLDTLSELGSPHTIHI